MKILCYGDSNTWGYNPEKLHIRYSKSCRYPMVLQKLLGKEHVVIEEGLCSRTIANDDPFHLSNAYNGSKHFDNCFKSNLPLDAIVLFLGSNDMKDYFNFDSYTAAKALDELYIAKIRQISPNSKIIIVIPKEIESTTFAGFENAKEKSKDFEIAYETIANKYNLDYISNDIIEIGSDGLHLSKKAHRNLAYKLYEILKN